MGDLIFTGTPAGVGKISENDKLESGNYKMKILKTYTDFLEDNEN